MEHGPNLPDGVPLNHLGLVLCGFLVESGLPKKMLMDRLHSIGWTPESGNGAAYRLLQRYESQGLICSVTSPSDTFYCLTAKGFDAWATTFDYQQKYAEFWSGVRHSKRKPFPEVAPTTRPQTPERPPTVEERAILLKEAPVAFRRVYEFALQSGARPMDLLNAKIQNLNRKKRLLILEEKSLTGRMIDNREVVLNESLLKILDEAIEDRRHGEIFLTPSGKPWSYEHFSATFRIIRQKCGIASDVVLSGRGGKIAGDAQLTRHRGAIIRPAKRATGDH